MALIEIKYIILIGAPLVLIGGVWYFIHLVHKSVTNRSTKKALERIRRTSPYNQDSRVKPGKMGDEFRARNQEKEKAKKKKQQMHLTYDPREQEIGEDGLMQVHRYNASGIQEEPEKDNPIVVGFVIVGKFTKRYAKEFATKILWMRAGLWTQRINMQSKVHAKMANKARGGRGV